MRAQRKKPCSKCSEVKTFAHFYKRKDAKDGRQSQCKACITARHLVNYYANREQYLAVQYARRHNEEFRKRDLIWRRKYLKTAKGQALKRESSRIWSLLHPEHQRRIELNQQARRRQARALGTESQQASPQ